MKGIGIFIAILLVGVIIYLYMIQKKAAEYAAQPKNVTNYNGGYELGLGLAQLIANTKCGKEGRPPCTKTELQASGWSPEQIAAAESGSTSLSNWSLCYNLGVNC